jgi:hypothetical protein
VHHLRRASPLVVKRFFSPRVDIAHALPMLGK